MAAHVLEAVPNFSEGRDAAVIGAIADAVQAAGAHLLDHSADPDHHRSVFTFVGAPDVVEDAAVAAARIARDRIDLRGHRGVHPRVGALDVLPFVPLAGLTLDDSRASAHRVGERLAGELGIPIYFYGNASTPPGRTLADLRRGGFETLAGGWPTGRKPDLLPGSREGGAHPTAGATCIGARNVLLAWNVFVDGLLKEAAGEVAARIRESGGGFHGVRALAFELPEQGGMQISMNIEDLAAAPPMIVFDRIETLVDERGGRVAGTEIIGMIPDELVFGAAAERLGLMEREPEKVLSRALARHLSHTHTARTIS